MTQVTVQPNPKPVEERIRDAKSSFSTLPYEGSVLDLFNKAYGIRLRNGGWDDSPASCKLGYRWSSYGCNLIKSLDTNRFNVHTYATWPEILLSMQKIAKNIYKESGGKESREYKISFEFVDKNILFKLLKKGDFSMPSSTSMPRVLNAGSRRNAFADLVDALLEGKDKVLGFHASYDIGNSREIWYSEQQPNENIPEKVKKDKSFLSKIGNSYFGGFSVNKEGSMIFELLSKVEKLIQEEIKEPLAVFPEEINMEYDRYWFDEKNMIKNLLQALPSTDHEVVKAAKEFEVHRRFKASLWWGDTPNLLKVAIERRTSNLSNQKLGIEWSYIWPSGQPEIMRNDAADVDDILMCMDYVGDSSHPSNPSPFRKSPYARDGGGHLPKEKFKEYVKLWELRKKFNFQGRDLSNTFS
jgi:hypothetical protein